MIVDFHNHYFPPAYLDAIRRGPSEFRITEDEAGHRSVDARIRDLDAAGVDVHVLTFTAPGTSIETPERAAELAPVINDGLAAAVEAHPERFAALGHLPLNAPDAAVEELDRAVEALGMPGFMLFGNAAGVPLADERFEPLWERADAHGCVLYIHPTYPVGVEAMEEYMLMPMVGFMFDTTLAAAHLVYAGVPDRYPGIEWVLGHLGGAIPYLAERLDRGWEAYERSSRDLDRPPSEVLKGFYYDTVNFDPACLELALGFAGADRLVAGSDYPHMIGSMTRMRESLERVGMTPDERRKVLGGNARGLLGV